MDAASLAEKLLESADRIAEAATADEGVFAKSYAPGKWTGRQLLAHIADADVVFLTRFWRAIAEPASEIVPFEQDLWVEHLKASERPVAISVGLIIATREAIAHDLRTLPAAALSRTAKRKDGTAMTALQMVEKVLSHGDHHLEQLEAIIEGKQWKKK